MKEEREKKERDGGRKERIKKEKEGGRKGESKKSEREGERRMERELFLAPDPAKPDLALCL